jgi:hypothetical protein
MLYVPEVVSAYWRMSYQPLLNLTLKLVQFEYLPTLHLVLQVPEWCINLPARMAAIPPFGCRECGDIPTPTASKNGKHMPSFDDSSLSRK